MQPGRASTYPGPPRFAPKYYHYCIYCNMVCVYIYIYIYISIMYMLIYSFVYGVREGSLLDFATTALSLGPQKGRTMPSRSTC